MRLLLDTNAWLWMTMRSQRLGSKTVALLSDPTNELCFSTVSAWEIIIKAGLGKLEVAGNPATFLRTRLARQRIEPLTATFEHVLSVGNLPLLHRDPFDRLIVAQSLYEDLPLVTSDVALGTYGITVYNAAE